MAASDPLKPRPPGSSNSRTTTTRLGVVSVGDPPPGRFFYGPSSLTRYHEPTRKDKGPSRMPLAPVSLNSRVTKTRRDTKTKALAPDQKTILSYFKLKSAEEDYEQDQQANDPSLLINNKPEPAEKHPGQVQQVCDPSPLIRKALSGDGNAAANTSKVDTKSKAKRSSPPSAAAHPLVVRSEPQNVDHVSDIDVFLDIADNLGGEDDSNDAKIVIEDVVNTSDSIADIGFFVDSVLQAEKSLQSCHDPQNPLKPIEAVDRAPDAIGSAQKKHAAALKSITAAREASSYGSISKDHPQDYKSTSIETLALLGVTPADRSSWSSCLMGLINMSDLIGIEEPLRVFFQRCKEDETWRHQSVEPVDAFVADAAPLSWRTHDPLIDDKWMELTQEVEALSEGRIVASTMPKPSGPLNAALTFVWHYPTWRTRGGTFGFVMDPTNPSLRAQHVKLGPSPLIRTLDMLLIRENFTEEGVCWADVYPNWEQINEKFSKFNRWLNRHSKIIVAVSRGVVDSLQDVVEFDDGATDIIEVRLDAPVKPFGKEPFFYVLQDRRTREIKQVVFLSYHAQYFYYRDPPMPQRAYHELLWNAAADLAGIHVVTPVYFLLQIRRAVPKNTRFDNTCMHRAIRLRAHEKRCDIIIPQFVVERILGPMIRRQGWTELRTSQGQAGQKRVYWYLKNLRTLEGWRRKRVYEDFVVIYAPHQPRGLRYEGDGGPPDTFPYDTEYHPAVRVVGKFSKEEREAFLELNEEEDTMASLQGEPSIGCEQSSTRLDHNAAHPAQGFDE